MHLKWAPQGRRVEQNNTIAARRAYFSLHFSRAPKGHGPRYTLYYHNQILLKHFSMQGNKNNGKMMKNKVFTDFWKKNITQTIPLLISDQLSSYYIICQCVYVCIFVWPLFKALQRKNYTSYPKSNVTSSISKINIFFEKIFDPPLWCHRGATMLT